MKGERVQRMQVVLAAASSNKEAGCRSLGAGTRPGFATGFAYAATFSFAISGTEVRIQVIEGAEGGLGAFAHGDDDLLVRHRGDVTGGEHARHRGLAAGVDFDLAARRQRHRALSHSLLGSRPICTKMPSSSTVWLSPLLRFL